MSCIKLRKKSYESSGIIVVHEPPRGRNTPCVSPFALKLETFLRMNNISYTTDFRNAISPRTKKTPWVEYNETQIDDSQLIIDYIKSNHNLRCDVHLSEEANAVNRAFLKLTEDSLYWAMVASTVYENQEFLRRGFSYKGLKLFLYVRIMKRVFKKALWGHGIGRHSPDVISSIGQSDLKAISHFLGEKSFMNGENPSEIDCAIFGLLAMIYWNTPGSQMQTLMTGELKNLEQYCWRMRDKYWSDWDDLICH